MTELLVRLITILDVTGIKAFVPEPPRGAGRPPEDRRGLARAFVAKALLGLATTSALIDRLGADKSLRRVCGWERRAQVPSEATFSRAFTECAQGDLPDRMHAALINRALGGRIIGAIARDATETEADEFGGRFVHVRGVIKVKCHLMFGILVLAVSSSPSIRYSASKSSSRLRLDRRRQQCPFQRRKNHSVDEFCKRLLVCGVTLLLGGSGGLVANPVTPPSSPRHPVSRIAQTSA